MKKRVFKDTMDRFITSGLFKETAQTKNWIEYTLKEAKVLFIECGDPTGYLFSEKHLGGYQHWLALKQSPALEHHLLSWEDELEVKIRAEGLKRVIEESEKKTGYQAAKYLVQAGWKMKELGRPTKQKIKEESIKRSKIYEEFGLTSVK